MTRQGKIAILDAAETRWGLPFGALIRSLRLAFAKGATAPTRHHHDMPQPDGTTAVLLLMPAWQESGYLGVKVVNVFPGNAVRGLPGLNSTYLLYDAASGEQLALLDGNEITSRRTAAVAALAASYLARPDASSLVIAGAGRVGSLLAPAFSDVRPIGVIAVWDLVHANAERLAERLCLDGYDARAIVDLEEAVRRADIVSCATLATKPFVKGEWLRPGTHLDLIGGFTPAMREADDDCVRRASIYVDTLDAQTEAGDLVQPLRTAVISNEAVVGSLAQLCAGDALSRKSDRQITLFKSVGTALADLAAGVLAFQSLSSGDVSQDMGNGQRGVVRMDAS